MARIRTIKPDFFVNDEIADLEPLTRLFFIGLWTQADREGRMHDRPRRLKAALMPYDECDVDALLGELEVTGHVIRYEVDGVRIIQVVNFLKHQIPHYKEVPSALPAPAGHTDSLVKVPPLTKAERDLVFARDGRVCRECGATDDLTIDHIIPRSEGGTNDPDNLRVLCRRCNSSKNNSTSARTQTDVGSSLHAGREGKGREGSGEPVGFSDVWEAYPVHRYQEAARSKYQDALDLGADPALILAACRAVPRDHKQSLGFFISDGTYRDHIPKQPRVRVQCQNHDCVNGMVVTEAGAVRCPDCNGGTA